MGCGSSTAAGAGSTLSKDPEDFHLEHMHFNKMKVPEFDVYLCDDLCPPVNKVVDIVNSINSCIDEVKDAAAIICGAFKLDIDLEGSADHDKLIVSLQKADGTHPTVEEAEKLYSDPKVAKADAELLKARKTLHDAMEQSYVKLSLAGDVLSAAAPPAGLDAFNKALGEMKAAVGAAYKIVLVHKVAGVGGAPCVRVTLAKPVFPKGDPFSDDYTLEPVSLLDVVRCKEAKNIFAAEAAVAEGLGGLTKAVKAAEAAGVQVSFELKKKKLVAKMEGEPSEQVSKAKAAVRKALSTANGQLFKLQKAARNANGIINITKALVAVFESFKASAMKLAKGSTKLISANPKVKFSLDDGVDFDLGLKIDIPDFEGMDPLEIVRKVLPGPAKIVFDAVLGIKDIVVEMIPEFTTLAEQVTELVSKSEEVFAEPADKIKAAFGDDNSDPFAVPKAVATAAGNLKTVAVEPVKIVTCMKETIARLADEMTAAADEVKVLLA